MNRVVITGQGAISALGGTAAENLASMRAGRNGIGPLSFQDTERLSIRIGGQIEGYDPAARFSRQDITLFDKFTQFALIAADEAMAQSGLALTEELSAGAGVVLGTAGGGLQTQDENYRSVYEEGKNRVHPFVVPR
ncbi:MAG: beta-ketoacyl synthase N-terminal-like domain-containing protein, partial [Pseudomonadota bacterium]